PVMEPIMEPVIELKHEPAPVDRRRDLRLRPALRIENALEVPEPKAQPGEHRSHLEPGDLDIQRLRPLVERRAQPQAAAPRGASEQHCESRHAPLYREPRDTPAVEEAVGILRRM